MGTTIYTAIYLAFPGASVHMFDIVGVYLQDKCIEIREAIVAFQPGFTPIYCLVDALLCRHVQLVFGSRNILNRSDTTAN